MSGWDLGDFGGLGDLGGLGELAGMVGVDDRGAWASVSGLGDLGDLGVLEVGGGVSGL